MLVFELGSTMVPLAFLHHLVKPCRESPSPLIQSRLIQSPADFTCGVAERSLVVLPITYTGGRPSTSIDGMPVAGGVCIEPSH